MRMSYRWYVRFSRECVYSGGKLNSSIDYSGTRGSHYLNNVDVPALFSAQEHVFEVYFIVYCRLITLQYTMM